MNSMHHKLGQCFEELSHYVCVQDDEAALMAELARIEKEQVEAAKKAAEKARLLGLKTPK